MSKSKSSPAGCPGEVLTLSEAQLPYQYNKDGMRLFYWVPRVSCKIISMKLFVTVPDDVTCSSYPIFKAMFKCLLHLGSSL